jgi:hypothetical protein
MQTFENQNLDGMCARKQKGHLISSLNLTSVMECYVKTEWRSTGKQYRTCLTKKREKKEEEKWNRFATDGYPARAVIPVTAF